MCYGWLKRTHSDPWCSQVNSTQHDSCCSRLNISQYDSCCSRINSTRPNSCCSRLNISQHDSCCSRINRTQPNSCCSWLNRTQSDSCCSCLNNRTQHNSCCSWLNRTQSDSCCSWLNNMTQHNACCSQLHRTQPDLCCCRLHKIRSDWCSGQPSGQHFISDHVITPLEHFDGVTVYIYSSYTAINISTICVCERTWYWHNLALWQCTHVSLCSSKHVTVHHRSPWHRHCALTAVWNVTWPTPNRKWARSCLVLAYSRCVKLTICPVRFLVTF